MDMDENDYADLTGMEAIAVMVAVIAVGLISIVMALWQTFIVEGLCGKVTAFLSGK